MTTASASAVQLSGRNPARQSIAVGERNRMAANVTVTSAYVTMSESNGFTPPGVSLSTRW